MANGGATHPFVCKAITEICPIYSGLIPAPGKTWSDVHDTTHVTRYKDQRDAVKMLAEHCDVIISWGMKHENAYDGVPFTGTQIIAAHGCSPWTREVAQSHRANGANVIAVSEAAAALIHPKPYSILNGVDPSRVAPKKDKTTQRAEWGLNAQDKIAAYIGRLSGEKNGHLIASAVANLNPEWKAVFIGEKGFVESTAQIKHIKDKLGDRAILIPETDDVGSALNAIDVYCLISPAEGCSIGLMEAWLAGTPTVTTRVGAVPELTKKHGDIATYVSMPEDDVEVSKAILQAHENKKVAENARQMMHHHYLAVHSADKWCDYIESITPRRDVILPAKSIKPSSYSIPNVSVLMLASKPRYMMQAVEQVKTLLPHYTEFLVGASPNLQAQEVATLRNIPRSRIVEGAGTREDAGPARFRLLDESIGDWIMNVDDDDLWVNVPSLNDLDDDVGLVSGKCMFLSLYLKPEHHNYCFYKGGKPIASEDHANDLGGSFWIIRNKAWDSISKEMDRMFWFSDWRLAWLLMRRGWKIAVNDVLTGMVRSFDCQYPTGPEWTWETYKLKLQQLYPKSDSI